MGAARVRKSSRKIPRLALRQEFAYRLLYPQVPAVLAAKSDAETTTAMPVTSIIPVSEEPAKLGVSIRIGLRTDRIMKRAEQFSLNWLDYKKRDLIRKLSSSSKVKKHNDKLRSNNIRYRVIFEAPVLEDSVAYLVCKKEKTLKIGDHNLYLGKVLGAMAILDFDEYWKFDEYKPILYVGSGQKTTFRTF
ncbi:MAG: flavin reductase family protein [Nitrososphaerales archaeon]